MIKRKITIGAVITILVLSMIVNPMIITKSSGYETQSYTDFTYYKSITISNSFIAKHLNGFPVLLMNTSDDFKSVFNGGHLQDDGDDIEFWSADNSTEFPYEVELYDNSTGEIVIWVNVSSISPSTDTHFWMYYGNETCGSNQNASSVWDENYVAVYHMNGTTATDIYDSTGNGHSVSSEYGNYLQYQKTENIGYSVYFPNTTGESEKHKQKPSIESGKVF